MSTGIGSGIAFSQGCGTLEDAVCLEEQVRQYSILSLQCMSFQMRTVAGRLALALALGTSVATGDEVVETDLLIVGGTESACAAAVQAARMGVERITLVNDIEWLGGQFSAEALMAIDENTDVGGTRHEQPIPRHGAFREVIDRIEADNLERYGVARPGNTRVITTCRPADAARVFREWLQPYVDRGQITIFSWYEPVDVGIEADRVQRVTFESRRDDPRLQVQATLTIDASDWGDVIRLSGASYEFGPDLKSKYGEPLAPERREGFPLTDMNPITSCMVIEETDTYEPIPKPAGYDARNYRKHGYPKDPLWLYGTRRLVDRYEFPQISHPDVLLLCFPAFDYPLDALPKSVADALEVTEAGASTKNIVNLTPEQRRIVFEDAKKYSLGFLYYLQTEVHDQMADKTHSFRRFRLTDEFGTPDNMPFKPYVRETLRMKSMYVMRQQDTMGVGDDSTQYAQAMYHDGVAVWQFEYDFHPTKREFLTADAPAGPWRNGFREGRTWGPPYSGRSLFPLRSLIPEQMDGLLGGQKNLGYSSIVSSAVRLHDQSMGIGQAVGACAAHSLLHGVEPREIPFDRNQLMMLQAAICDAVNSGQPGMVWPFRDLEASDPAYTAANMLAVHGCLPLAADDVKFRSKDIATSDWTANVVRLTNQQLTSVQPLPALASEISRGEFVTQWWDVVQNASWKPYQRLSQHDADGDGVADRDDALPFDSSNVSFPVPSLSADSDGVPSEITSEDNVIQQFNFAGTNTPPVVGFVQDTGEQFADDRGFGWQRSVIANNRWRHKTATLADTYLFTRTRDVWEFAVPDGNYIVELSVGDSAYTQIGQNVTVEGVSAIRNRTTQVGRFAEATVDATVRDGRLTIEIGREGSTKNTCLNWLRLSAADE